MVATARTLYVLRHAKSDWSSGVLADFDRPLAPRGRKAVDRLARHVVEAGVTPELVLSSPARRARDTITGVLPEAPVGFDDGLYGAGAFELIDRLRGVDPDVGSVMLVGHNPGLHDLVEVLSDAEIDKFPTGALATLVVASPWPDLGPGGAVMAGLVVPRDLG